MAIAVMMTDRANPWAASSNALRRLMSRSFSAPGAYPTKIEFLAALPIGISIPISGDKPSLSRSCGHGRHGPLRKRKHQAAKLRRIGPFTR